MAKIRLLRGSSAQTWHQSLQDEYLKNSNYVFGLLTIVSSESLLTLHTTHLPRVYESQLTSLVFLESKLILSIIKASPNSVFLQ
jgi:hypothetical protein